MSLVRLEQHDTVAVIVIDYPPVNAMGVGVPRGIVEYIEQANADAATGAIVLVGGGRGVIAGADIRRQGKPWPDAEPDLRDAIATCEASQKPIIACLRGATLGGGLELVMACNYRLATEAAQIGQPEVKLGIPPGAGGTQRLPRLAGVEAALEMILSGDPVDAKRAAELNVVDAIAPQDAIAFAVKFAAEKARATDRHPRARDGAAELADPQLFDKARARVARRARGQRAPLACIECVEAAVSLPFDDGIAFERRLFDECVTSPEAAAMRHLFFAERAARKLPGVNKDTALHPISSAAVIGAGTMGGGIAMCFADAGMPVTLVDKDDAVLTAGLQRVQSNYQRSVKSGRLSDADVKQRLQRIVPATDLQALGDADIVIEAVFEEMDLKQQIFRSLGGICKADAILASNTSYLDVNAIAATVPDRIRNVLGLHFFSPANIMRLLEVVRGNETSPQTLASAIDLAQKLGKLPVVAGVCHGFIGNRMLEEYRREADFLLEEGALPQQVDEALTGFGLAMGPFAVADLAGLDIGWRKRRANAHLRDPQRRYSALADRLCELGRFGQKTGSGYYRYADGERAPIPDPEVEQLIFSASAELNITRREIDDEEIVQRCMYPLINEGARILEEGIALRASDIDLVYVNGYGFPAWRGGPMFWAEQIGLDEVLATLRDFASLHDFREPAPLLEKLVAEHRGFIDFDAGAE
ncbi:MAG: 3-hydroxyacyl-CoA dehydrogenase NAD-binding domain-containing protein [Gammaproteobacteria bacterium]|nr:3-hydroxyacyl-CoA dehydrogenase NAD-binding domain-containing protein [Gammaproteobacteria bacterium]